MKKFSIITDKQKNCPVCKKTIKGDKNSSQKNPVESVSLSATCLISNRGKNKPTLLGSVLILGWDSGKSTSIFSRRSIGAAFTLASSSAASANPETARMLFCSTSCLKKFFAHTIDRLDKEIKTKRNLIKK